jgi:hypothetical protein
MLLHVMNSLNTSYATLSFQNYSERVLDTVKTESNFTEVIKQVSLKFKDLFSRNVSLLSNQRATVGALSEKIFFQSSVLLTLSMAGLVAMIFAPEEIIQDPNYLELDHGHSNRNPINRRNLQRIMPYEVKGKFPRLTYENYLKAIDKRIQIDSYENYDDLMNMINNPIEIPKDIYGKFPRLTYEDYLDARNKFNDSQIQEFSNYSDLIRKIKIPAEVLEIHPEIDLFTYNFLRESLSDEKIRKMSSSDIVDHIDIERFKITKEELEFLKKNKINIESLHQEGKLLTYLQNNFNIHS